MVTISIVERAAPLPTRDDYRTFTKLLEQAFAALERDEFLQSSFLPVFCGHARPLNPDIPAFRTSINNWLSSTTILVHLEATFRAADHDGIVRLNNTLARACMRDYPDSTYFQLVAITTAYHQAANIYGLSVRSQADHYAPIELALSGYEDSVNINGIPTTVGEAGFVQEQGWLGGPLHILVPRDAAPGDYSCIEGVQLDVDDQYYDIPRHVAAQFLLQFQEDLTATLFSLLGSSPTPAAPLHAGLRRLRCLENHSPPAPETRGPVDSSGVPFGLVRQPRSSDRYADE